MTLKELVYSLATRWAPGATKETTKGTRALTLATGAGLASLIGARAVGDLNQVGTTWE